MTHLTSIEHRFNADLQRREHRWTCSCGAGGERWKPREFQAQQGATKHGSKSK